MDNIEKKVAEGIPETENLSKQNATEVEADGGDAIETEGSSNGESGLTQEFSKLTKPYHERYYLLYDGQKRSTALDLSGTSAFLQGIGFDGGELRQARLGKGYSTDIRNAQKSEQNQMFCSYCGTPIAGVEFFRMPDGRVRCTACSNAVVKTKPELEALCNRVIENMNSFFGATIEVSVSIEVMDELKLKKAIGLPLGGRDKQSMLVLGAAVNKKNDYKIYLENGAPRLSLIATFAHELTHIWQYTHWDKVKTFKQCPTSKRVLLYEGMAKWAEIQYLYLVGETNAAQREETITRMRQDEYGVGFSLYENRYPITRATMRCDTTPFTPTGYPFD